MPKPLEALTLETLRRMLRATVEATGPDAPSVRILQRAVAAKRRPRERALPCPRKNQAPDGGEEGEIA